MHAGKSVNSLQLAVKRRTRFVSPRNIHIYLDTRNVANELRALALTLSWPCVPASLGHHGGR